VAALFVFWLATGTSDTDLHDTAEQPEFADPAV
jgi:hypothetical protein